MNPWIVSLRLRTLPLAISVISVGAVLAYKAQMFRWNIYALAILTTVLLQILSNLANEYGDFEKGTDNDDREGPKRSMQSGVISKEMMLNAIKVFVLLSFSTGLFLLYTAFGFERPFWAFLGFGIVSILGAIYYTFGGNAYGYKGLGDISVFVFFGLLGVVGSYYLFTQQIDPFVWLPAATVGVFATAVLNVNNIRDIENDRTSGKITIPVRLGQKKAIYYHWTLLEIGWWASVIYTYFNLEHNVQWLFLLITPLLIKNAIGVYKHAGTSELDPYLKQMVMTTLLYVILFGIGILCIPHFS